MKLKMGIMQTLMIAMKQVDVGEKIVLKGPVRLALAINLNRLQPFVEAYEKVKQAEALRLSGDKPFLTAASQLQLALYDT